MSNNNLRSISIKSNTLEKIKSLIACYQIAYKQELSYSEILNLLLDRGVPYLDEKVASIYSTIYNTPVNVVKIENTSIPFAFDTSYYPNEEHYNNIDDEFLNCILNEIPTEESKITKEAVQTIKLDTMNNTDEKIIETNKLLENESCFNEEPKK